MAEKQIPIARPVIGDEEINAVADVLNSGMLAQGEVVYKFEEEFAHYVGVKHAIATSSGTTALHTLLWAIGNVRDVLVPSLTFIATATPAIFVGARVQFVDIDRRTYNMAPEFLAHAISKCDGGAVVIPVHLYGQPADMDEIMDLCEEAGMVVVEDACQAHGALYDGKKVGGIGYAGVFSFYPTKNMTTIEGGMITTNDDDLAEMCRMIRDHGQREHYRHEILGHNFRMTNVSAALGLVQLKKLEKMNDARIRNAKILDEHLKNTGVLPPYVAEKRKHVYHLYSALCPDRKARDSLLQYLNERGVGARVGYPMPIYRQKVFHDIAGNFVHENAEYVVERHILLPVHPLVSVDDAHYIGECVENWWEKWTDGQRAKS